MTLAPLIFAWPPPPPLLPPLSLPHAATTNEHAKSTPSASSTFMRRPALSGEPLRPDIWMPPDPQLPERLTSGRCPPPRRRGGAGDPRLHYQAIRGGPYTPDVDFE